MYIGVDKAAVREAGIGDDGRVGIVALGDVDSVACAIIFKRHAFEASGYS